MDDPNDGSFRHAVESLEFAAVLDLIASRCANDTAGHRVRARHPAADEKAITESLETIEEYRRYREENGELPVADTGYRAHIERLLSANDPLETDELLRLASGERVAVELQKLMTTEAERFPRMAASGTCFAGHPDLVGAVERAIDNDGAIKDDATPKLRSIRREIHRARHSLRALSEKMAGQHGEGSYPTLLGSRYVLLVPRAQAGRDGLVHATSHTGGSLYYEPFPLVEKNNALETLSSDETAEVARILKELNESVRAAGDELVANAERIDQVDELRAIAGFCERFQCASPGVSDNGSLRLARARHPLLVVTSQGEDREVVPLDLELHTDRRVLVITGPNAGGKTVTLKTVGVAALLFQSGIPVPCASGTELPVFTAILADIGDEQSIEASLSTFTSHLAHLDEMCRRAGPNTLCLIDEIGDGTDPDEGAALAVATLERLVDAGAAVVASTHYGRIKVFALQSPGVANASMAFEDAEGRPLYRLLQGIAGRSRGIETARRRGFDPGVISRAERYLGADAFRLESVLAELEATHHALERERESLESRLGDAEILKNRYEELAAEFDVSKRQADRRASLEAEELLRETRRQIEAIVREIRGSQARRDVLRRSHERIEQMLKQAHSRRPARNQAPGRDGVEKAAEVSPGDRVSVSPTGSPSGIVTSVENGVATVEINDKRIKLSVDSLYAVAAEADKAPQPVTYQVHVEPLSSTTLDVRGNEREEALESVNRFLDRAVLSGVQEVKIIHGIGEGILADAIRAHLQSDVRVESTRPGGLVEGGMGVTFVTLR